MVCCIAQIVTLGSQLQEYTSYNETGLDDPIESMFFSVSRHLTDVIVYTTILLLSLGFSLTRDQLSIRELRLGSGVIFLYIVLGNLPTYILHIYIYELYIPSQALILYLFILFLTSLFFLFYPTCPF